MPRIFHRPMYGFIPMVGARILAGAAAYVAYSARFTDTDPDFLYSNTLAPADNNQGTISFWFKRASTGIEFLVSNGTTSVSNRVVVKFLSGNTLRVELIDSSNTPTLTGTGTTAITDTNWHHCLIAFDNSNSLDYKFNMYLDGVDETPTGTFATDVAVGWSRTGFILGCKRDQVTSPYNGCLSEVWIASGQYITDHTLFRSGAGKPISLGSDGSTPGTQPDIYLRDPAATFETNYGSLGNFIDANAVTACVSSPTD